MKKITVLFFIVFLDWLILISVSNGQDLKIGTETKKVPGLVAAKEPGISNYPGFGKTPLYFVPNKGQISGKARCYEYYAKTPHYILWITNEGLVFDRINESQDQKLGDRQESGRNTGKLLERDVSRLVFLNANKNTEILSLDVASHQVNYFIGNDPSRWQKGIATSKVILYKEIYTHIDLKVYGNESQVEYDWIIKPGGNPADIRFEYKSIQGTSIDHEGNLVINNAFGKMVHHHPQSFQIRQGEKVTVSSKFRQIEKNIYGFSIGQYDKNYELILDPIVSLIYSTYVGGSNSELYGKMVVDKTGQVYLTGYSYSIDFPTQNAYQGNKNY